MRSKSFRPMFHLPFFKFSLLGILPKREILLLVVLFLSCARSNQKSIFSVKQKDGYKEITDGIGRKLVLVQKGAPVPEGYKNYQIIRVPVKKVIAYSLYTVALIKELGHIDTVCGVVFKKNVWKEIPEIKNGMEKGKVLFLGLSTCIDYEKLRSLKPDVVFSWSQTIAPKLKELGIPCVITDANLAPGIKDRIRFILFISEFFNESEKAKKFVEKQYRRIDKICSRLKNVTYRPKVIWGDIYPRKILIEPGNSWAAEAIKKAAAIYLFDDIRGPSYTQITIEKFFSKAKDADIIITYRGPEFGINSKKMLINTCPILKNTRALHRVKIYSTKWILWQTADTASIIYELASIFHPMLFPKKRLKYFYKLPEGK